MQMIAYGVGILAVLGVGMVAAMWIGARVAPRPANVNNGTLAPCPNDPNCVCTEDTDKVHSIAAIPYSGGQAAAREALLGVLRGLDKVDIVQADDEYIYAESRSPMMSFVDDMEFVLDDDAKVIRFRSAARLGKSDMGKNRERMELIRERLDSSGLRSRSDESLAV